MQQHIIFIFQNLMRQQQKMFQQTRVVQSQRLRTIRQLFDQYTKVGDQKYEIEVEILVRNQYPPKQQLPVHSGKYRD